MSSFGLIHALVLVSLHLTCASPVIPKQQLEESKTADSSSDLTELLVRSSRHGGFPKFPNSNHQCGARTVEHHAVRLGQSKTPTFKIIGGSIPPYGSYPWQANIQVWQSGRRKYKHQCGASIVASKWIITAAHCLTGARPERIRVLVGEYNLLRKDQFEQFLEVEEIIRHPEHSLYGEYSNDIALVKVKSKNSTAGITFSSYVQPICLPRDSSAYSPGTWCTVTGWGKQKPDDSMSQSPVLRAAAVPLLAQSTCRRPDVYGTKTQDILDGMVCAGYLQGGIDSCGGDSGGPLACQVNGQFQLMGIVSWGDGCAAENKPGVYVRVAHYISWIDQLINNDK